jgi:hypothetical protein
MWDGGRYGAVKTVLSSSFSRTGRYRKEEAVQVRRGRER